MTTVGSTPSLPPACAVVSQFGWTSCDGLSQWPTKRESPLRLAAGRQCRGVRASAPGCRGDYPGAPAVREGTRRGRPPERYRPEHYENLALVQVTRAAAVRPP